MARAFALLVIVLVLAVSGCGGSGGGGAAGNEVRATGDDVLEAISAILRGEPAAIGTLPRWARARARAAEDIRGAITDPATGDAACATVDWIDAQGGVTAVSYQGIYNFAASQFDRQYQAEEFADDVKSLTDLDLSGLPGIACQTRDTLDGS